MEIFMEHLMQVQQLIDILIKIGAKIYITNRNLFRFEYNNMKLEGLVYVDDIAFTSDHPEIIKEFTRRLSKYLKFPEPKDCNRFS